MRVNVLGRCRHVLGRRGELEDDAAEPLAQLLVEQLPLRIETLVRARHRELRLEHAGAGNAEHAAEVALGPDGAVRAGGGAGDRDRLAPQRTRARRPGGPVDRVLQLSGDGSVVLRRRDQQRVGAADRVPQPRAFDRAVLLVVVLVVRGQELEPVVELELHARRSDLGRFAQERGVVGAATEAPRDREDAHYFPFTAETSMTMRTSSGSRKPPPGSGAFHLTPKSLRSTTPLSSSATRSPPHGSVAGPATEPVSSISFVTPLSVRSPITLTEPSPSCSNDVERNVAWGK